MDFCVPEYCKSPVLVLGCGNILFGDDGFGPAVVKQLLHHHKVPDDVCIIDVGTGIREVLCTLALSPVKPQKIVIIDTMDTGRMPGKVFVASIGNFPPAKQDGASLHQQPTLSLLQELKDCCHLDILLVLVQPASIPEAACPGLSHEVKTIIPTICKKLLNNHLSTRA